MPPDTNSTNIEVKICGLDRPESVDAAVEGGARYVGFVFYPPSPRNLEPAEARLLTERVPLGIHRVALFVDPTDIEIDRVFAQNQFDMIQLHGSETPDRTNNIRARTGTQVMKVIKLSARADLAAAATYRGAADWSLLAGAEMALPWMLAGGLTADNLAQAVAASGASQVDVSSGVENAPGVKSPDKIRAFLAAAATI